MCSLFAYPDVTNFNDNNYQWATGGNQSRRQKEIKLRQGKGLTTIIRQKQHPTVTALTIRKPNSGWNDSLGGLALDWLHQPGFHMRYLGTAHRNAPKPIRRCRTGGKHQHALNTRETDSLTEVRPDGVIDA